MISTGFAHFAEFELQIIALVWLVLLYVIKSYQLAHLPTPWEKAPQRGKAFPGIMRSYSTIFMPWSMESSKNHLWRWVEFGAYHVGALVAILNTFTSPLIPGIMTQPVRLAFAIIIAPAFIMGITKLWRRVSRPEMRLISTPDDYFSLISVELYFISAILALLVNTPLWRTIYYLITAGFLFYVPFSKISHYVYFLFAGIITGSRYGWRGVRPEVRKAQ
jgi:nitrate reductase gamma subunit